MEREQFTFYASFAKAARKIKKPAERCAYYDALIDYALSGAEPDEAKLPEIVCMAMELVMPVLASSRRKAENGKKGGSKPEANASKAEANASKPEARDAEANPKQGESASKKEDKKEGEDKKESKKEKENECYLSPPSPSSPTSAPKPKTATAIAEDVMQGWPQNLKQAVRDWLSYKVEKRQGYKETGLRALLSQIWKARNEFGEEAVIEVIRNSMASGYAGITLDRLAAAPASKPKHVVPVPQKPLTSGEWDAILDKI
jgi:hypothetical protein